MDFKWFLKEASQSYEPKIGNDYIKLSASIRRFLFVFSGSWISDIPIPVFLPSSFEKEKNATFDDEAKTMQIVA